MSTSNKFSAAFATRSEMYCKSMSF
jgi:hypothetical protein